MPPAAKSIGPVGDGFLAVNPDAFPNDFAADAPPGTLRDDTAPGMSPCLMVGAFLFLRGAVGEGRGPF
jgi:hypothetical protein